MGAVHERRQKGDTFAGYTDLEVTICTCGVLFAMPARMLEQRREDGKGFYCPHGHSLSFHETELDRLRQRAEWAEQQRNTARRQRDDAEASARAQKAAATRARNQRDRDRKRVANGVCPCCNRTFANLARHMKSQHPDFSHDTDAERTSA